MIRIVTPEGDLDLSPDTRLSINKFSQFSFLENSGTSTYQFQVPLSRNNCILLKYAHKLRKLRPNVPLIPAQIFKDGALILSGKLNVIKATNKFIELFFVAEYAALLTDLDDIFLRQLDYPSFDIPNGQTTMEFIFEKGIDPNWQVWRVFSVYNEALSFGSNPLFKLQNILRFETNGSLTFGFSRANLTPFLRQNWLISHVLAQLGYNLQSNWFDSHEDLRNICFYNNCIYETGFQTNPVHVIDLIMEMNVQDFITSIENFWGVSFLVEAGTKNVHIISNAGQLSREPLDFISPLVKEYQIEFIKGEALKTKGVSLEVEFSDGVQVPGEISLDMRLPLYGVPVSPPDVKEGQIRGTWQGLADFSWTAPYYEIYDGSQWIAYQDENLNDVTTIGKFSNGEEPVELTTKACWPKMKTWFVDNQFMLNYAPGSVDADYTQRVCEVNIPHNTPGNPNFVDYNIIYMIYRGFHDHAYGATITPPQQFLIPTGNTDLVDHQWNIVASWKWTLKFNNDEQVPGSGIIDQIWKRISNVVFGEKVQIRRHAKIMPAQLAKLDLTRLYIVDGNLCIIEAARQDVSHNSYSLTELTLLRL